MIPMSYGLAANVTVGSLACWALVTKFILVFSNVPNTTVTALVLLQMARSFLLDHGLVTGQLKHEIVALFYLGLWLGIVFAVGTLLFLVPVLSILLGDTFDALEFNNLRYVVSIVLLQIPLLIFGLIMSKIAIAAGQKRCVVYAAGFSFAANCLINVVLVPQIGLRGVAIGVTVGGFIYVVSIFMRLCNKMRLPVKSVITTLIVVWLIFLVLCVGLLSSSLSTLVVGSIALMAVMTLQVLIWCQKRRSREVLI